MVPGTGGHTFVIDSLTKSNWRTTLLETSRGSARCMTRRRFAEAHLATGKVLRSARCSPRSSGVPGP